MSKNTIKKLIIVVISLVFIAVTVFVYADYTKSNKAKRVVVNAGGSGALFSSNFLAAEMDATENKRVIYTLSGSSPAVATITICNYAQGSTNPHYDKDITYDLVARLVDSNGDPLGDGITVPSGYVTLTFNDSAPITIEDKSAHTVISHSTLSKNNGNSDKLVVSFSTVALDRDDIYLKLETEVKNRPADILDLKGMLRADHTSIAEAHEWSGSFNEDSASDDSSPVNVLDGFNYKIEGNGRGTFTLSWDPSMLKISDYFIETFFTDRSSAIQTAANGDSFIDIAVDSNDISRYDIQFYRADDVSDSVFDTWLWSNLKDCVNYSFVKWYGHFTEEGDPSSMTEFTYFVEGNGSSVFTLRWDTTKLDCGTLPGGWSTVIVGNYKEVTVNVDSNTEDVYTLVFTPASSVDRSGWTWEKLKKEFVTYTARASS